MKISCYSFFVFYQPQEGVMDALSVLHTSSFSYVAVPVQDQNGEKAGWWSLINWHCGMPMRRVLGENMLKAWICPHCQHRKYPPLMR
jgi:hypothetical protein